MSVRDPLRQPLHRVGVERSHDRLRGLGVAGSAIWLVLVVLLVWLEGDDAAPDRVSWLVWLMGVLLPLGLIWVAVWFARSLVLLRQEAEELRAQLHQLGGGKVAAGSGMTGPASRRIPPPPLAGLPAAVATAPVPAPTPVELFLALNFPDGPEDHAAVRCLRLALGDPALARLIRAAQDVVTLLAGQGIYMDDIALPETGPEPWRALCEGQRDAAVGSLALIRDEAMLELAGRMLREDEIFCDAALHFLRQYEGLLVSRGRLDPELPPLLAQSRSGRAFLLLSQASGFPAPGPGIARS